jgi:hypothetical protein
MGIKQARKVVRKLTGLERLKCTPSAADQEYQLSRRYPVPGYPEYEYVIYTSYSDGDQGYRVARVGKNDWLDP